MGAGGCELHLLSHSKCLQQIQLYLACRAMAMSESFASVLGVYFYECEPLITVGHAWRENNV